VKKRSKTADTHRTSRSQSDSKAPSLVFWRSRRQERFSKKLSQTPSVRARGVHAVADPRWLGRHGRAKRRDPGRILLVDPGHTFKACKTRSISHSCGDRAGHGDRARQGPRPPLPVVRVVQRATRPGDADPGHPPSATATSSRSSPPTSTAADRRHPDRWPIKVAYEEGKHLVRVGHARNRTPACSLGDAVGFSVGMTQGQPQPGTVVGRPQGAVDRSQRPVEHDLVDAGVVVEVLDVA
jgi:hypothetical protein